MKLLPERGELERALTAHDPAYDGVFYVAVRTTGVFCRPSCRPPRSPRPENVEFFGSVQECLLAGYRPCKLCRPDQAQGAAPSAIADLMHRVESDPELRLTAGGLRELGLSPERVRRWFLAHQGMTFAAWCRARRLATAFTRIREGAPLDDVTLGHGFESHSGFRSAFARAFGVPPGQSHTVVAKAGPLVTTFLDTPIGRMLTAANDAGVALLEFNDRTMRPANLASLERRFGQKVVPGRHRHLETLRRELDEYFAGKRREFAVPLVVAGTPFQERVWAELRRIPCAETRSYEDVARRIGRPGAVRAVGRANGQNRLSILIPCHRVVGQDGTLTGYGGGLWRKRLLLELERTGQLPR
jgi:AraC family transcriptional regulator of adaptative response/methylated-DNA-[protein]-cysteine methyltransferase